MIRYLYKISWLSACILSCTTPHLGSKQGDLSFFKGKIAYEAHGQKKQFLVDIFLHNKTSALRMDLISPFGLVYLVIFWEKPRGSLVLFPMHKAYFKNLPNGVLKTISLPPWMIKDLSWLKQVLLRQTLDGWNCHLNKLAPNDQIKKNQTLQKLKCKKEDLSVEWTGYKNQQVFLRFKNSKALVSARIYKEQPQSSFHLNNIFRWTIPSHYKVLKKIDEFN